MNAVFSMSPGAIGICQLIGFQHGQIVLHPATGAKGSHGLVLGATVGGIQTELRICILMLKDLLAAGRTAVTCVPASEVHGVVPLTAQQLGMLEHGLLLLRLVRADASGGEK